MKIRPAKDRVIVQLLKAEEQSSGGIILPETSREKPYIGQVVASGIAEYKEGEIILFGKFAGSAFVLGDEEYTALEVKDIIGVIEEDDERSSS